MDAVFVSGSWDERSMVRFGATLPVGTGLKAVQVGYPEACRAAGPQPYIRFSQGL